MMFARHRDDPVVGYHLVKAVKKLRVVQAVMEGLKEEHGVVFLAGLGNVAELPNLGRDGYAQPTALLFDSLEIHGLDVDHADVKSVARQRNRKLPSARTVFKDRTAGWYRHDSRHVPPRDEELAHLVTAAVSKGRRATNKINRWVVQIGRELTLRGVVSLASGDLDMQPDHLLEILGAERIEVERLGCVEVVVTEQGDALCFGFTSVAFCKDRFDLLPRGERGECQSRTDDLDLRQREDQPSPAPQVLLFSLDDPVAEMPREHDEI